MSPVGDPAASITQAFLGAHVKRQISRARGAERVRAAGPVGHPRGVLRIAERSVGFERLGGH